MALLLFRSIAGSWRNRFLDLDRELKIDRLRRFASRCAASLEFELT
jgi:hypothetical protein